jgi:hypothetical protein
MQRNEAGAARMAINLGIGAPADYGRAPRDEGLY